MTTKITSVSISNYYGDTPSGVFTFAYPSGSTTLDLPGEISAEIFNILYRHIEAQKQQMAESLLAIETTPALTGPIIDNGEIPF